MFSFFFLKIFVGGPAFLAPHLHPTRTARVKMETVCGTRGKQTCGRFLFRLLEVAGEGARGEDWILSVGWNFGKHGDFSAWKPEALACGSVLAFLMACFPLEGSLEILEMGQ